MGNPLTAISVCKDFFGKRQQQSTMIRLTLLVVLCLTAVWAFDQTDDDSDDAGQLLRAVRGQDMRMENGGPCRGNNYCFSGCCKQVGRGPAQRCRPAARCRGK